MKGDEDRRVSVGDPVRHLAREDVSRAGGFALGRGRGERMEVDASELPSIDRLNFLSHIVDGSFTRRGGAQPIFSS